MYQNTLERAVSNRGYLNRTNCPQFPLPQIEMYISRESIGSKMSKYVYPNPYSRFHYKIPLLKASNAQKNSSAGQGPTPLSPNKKACIQSASYLQGPFAYLLASLSAKFPRTG